ncbi:hypothetical protein [uncultured Pontibacter sp.]|uniref:hypothetical protein n=1 Tax=uncultured Pontibacter sp. TaxID=453356 RepID=UPI00261777B2|nr:hypothetical protein [uncultured Pontibacter sp.]
MPIDHYLWDLPTGWTVADNRAYWNGSSYEDIKVIPAKGDGGTTINKVRVRAYSKTCNTSYNYGSPLSYVSNEEVLYIDREPQLGNITASRASLHCGDKSSITFSVPTLPNAAYYTWPLPAGWSISGSADASTVTVVPSGQSGGQVSVAAT